MVLLISFSLPFFSYHLLPPFDFLEYNVGDEMSFTLYDADFNDVTLKEISKGKSMYIITIRRELTTKNRDMIDRLTSKANKDDRDVIAISPNIKLIDDLDGMRLYFADDLAVKSMMRKDVGVILVEDGVIRGKWSLDTKFSRFNENFQGFKMWIWGGFYLLLLGLLFRVNFRDYEE